MIVERGSIDSGARAPRGGRFWRSLSAEAVAQTNVVVGFLYVCDKVTILGRTISVAEDPLCPAEPLSRGQRNWPLSDSYNRFGLCDSRASRTLRRKSCRRHLS